MFYISFHTDHKNTKNIGNQATDKLRVSLSEDKKGGSKLDVKFSSDVDVDKILNALAELLMNC